MKQERRRQQWVAEKSKVSRGTISQLAIDDGRLPAYKNAIKVIKVLREIDPSIRADQFWDI
ncbi:XRE family transcriptional regulator [Paenibacillus sp. LPE1-1-1.1]|uniref:XRE family transcriptional regulator n=1 Tax=Paenibacillus sp. LPE1-1-1.1 TaxID=3135230 RepID=UPI003438102A